MYQHPIPQNVTSYQFRLIGDMTIKQFLMLGGGIGLAALIWFSNTPSIIKWSLGPTLAAGGFALAFIPIEERPLDHWIIAFIRAIYRPTQFAWNKNPTIPQYFSYTSSPRPTTDTSLPLNPSQKQTSLNTFMETLPHQKTPNQIDQSEQEVLQRFSSMFASTHSRQSSSNQSHLKSYSPIKQDLGINLQSDNSQQTLSSKPLPEVETPANETFSTTPSITPKPTPPQDTPQSTPSPQPQLNNLPQAQSKSASSVESISATTSTSLPFPSTPTTPNTIVGMVLDSQDNLVDNAIVEIKNDQGMPVRATKTNKLGQFFSATPLKKGEYTIQIDKPGYKFSHLKIALADTIIDPIKINAKA